MADGFADVSDLVKKVANGMQICAFLIIITVKCFQILVYQRSDVSRVTKRHFTPYETSLHAL
jgi:hypothetical protein